MAHGSKPLMLILRAWIPPLRPTQWKVIKLSHLSSDRHMFAKACVHTHK